MSTSILESVQKTYTNCSFYSDKGQVLYDDKLRLEFSTLFQSPDFLRFEWKGKPFESYEVLEGNKHCIILSNRQKYFYAQDSGSSWKIDEAETLQEILEYDSSKCFRVTEVIIPLLFAMANFETALPLRKELKCIQTGSLGYLLTDESKSTTQQELLVNPQFLISKYSEQLLISAKKKLELAGKSVWAEENSLLLKQDICRKKVIHFTDLKINDDEHLQLDQQDYLIPTL